MPAIAVTCATIAAALASVPGGSQLRLSGNCSTIEIARKYTQTVTIDANGASVRGLVLTGENIAWRGGTIAAPKGRSGIARDGYAVYSSGARISISGATITDARKGLVANGGFDLTITGNRFVGLREDGVHVNATGDLVIERNSFSGTAPQPNRCDGRPTEVARRACTGRWEGGDHPGAVQLRNGVVNARIRFNTIEGNTSGIGQNDLKGRDAPIRNILIEGNRVSSEGYNPIKLQQNCIGCTIRGNIVRRGRPDRKAVIKPGAASRCGNDVADEKGDAPCR